MRILSVIILLSALAFGESSHGERFFKSKCAPCHSVDGSASSPIARRLKLRDLRSPDVQRQTDRELAEVIAKGRPGMPSFQRQLSDQQLAELVQYVRSLAHTPTPNATPTR
jgi:mono/diheme cytochrome c family protein